MNTAIANNKKPRSVERGFLFGVVELFLYVFCLGNAGGERPCAPARKTSKEAGGK